MCLVAAAASRQNLAFSVWRNIRKFPELDLFRHCMVLAIDSMDSCKRCIWGVRVRGLHIEGLVFIGLTWTLAVRGIICYKGVRRSEVRVQPSLKYFGLGVLS